MVCTFYVPLRLTADLDTCVSAAISSCGQEVGDIWDQIWRPLAYICQEDSIQRESRLSGGMSKFATHWSYC